MTAVGKILVFLNLVFSLVVGAFVIMIYLARTHWVDELNKFKNQNTVLEASARTYQAEALKAQQDAASQVEKIKKEVLAHVQQDLNDANQTIDRQSKELKQLEKTSKEQTALATKYAVEVEKRQEDVAKLNETLLKERQANNTLVKEKAELENEATVAKIERDSVKDQNSRMEVQLRKMAEDITHMRSNGGSRAMARASGKNPPQENIEGLVKNTDVSGLMTLTIGSDSGLTKGHTLELFRLNPSAPSQSKYLGTVRILEAEAKQAVAQPVGRLNDKPRAGDRVASRILGG